MKKCHELVLLAALAAFSTTTCLAQTGTADRGIAPLILAQAGSMPQGTGGVGQEGKVGGAPKTESMRQKEKAALAKCNAMPNGAPKDACIKDYRTNVGKAMQLPSGEWAAQD